MAPMATKKIARWRGWAFQPGSTGFVPVGWSFVSFVVHVCLSFFLYFFLSIESGTLR
jgi:hypothetical protein